MLFLVCVCDTVQWGMPTISTGAVFGMLAGVLVGTMSTVANYYACARLAGAPPPPTHAVNRGIGTNHRLNGSSIPELSAIHGEEQNSTLYKIKTRERIQIKFGTYM